MEFWWVISVRTLRSVIDDPKVSIEPALLVLRTIISELDFRCPTCIEIIKLHQLPQHQEGCVPQSPITQCNPVPKENPAILPTPPAHVPATIPDPATPCQLQNQHHCPFYQYQVTLQPLDSWQHSSYFTVQPRTIQQSKRKLVSLLFASSLNNHRMVQLFFSKQVVRYTFWFFSSKIMIVAFMFKVLY